MQVAPVPRLTVRNSLAATALLILAGCGGGHAARIAAEPAERLDRPAPSTPAEVRASVAFDEKTIREETIDESAAADSRPKGKRPPAVSATRGPAAPQEEEDDDAPVRHRLHRGQTLYSVARLYGVEVSALMKANGIGNAHKVAAGTVLLIPLAKPTHRSPAVTTASVMPLPGKEDDGRDDGDGKDDARVAAAPALAWPIQGLITAPYGRRGKSDHHEGIDIDGETGDPIHAAASGTVVFAGTHGDYGRTVVIDHGDGLRTVYAHASALEVQEGDPVRVGETIAEVGHSGNARGSHLHFEVRRDGRPVNPMPFLRSPDLLTASVVPAPTPHGKSAKKKSAPRH
ncbi:MAG TPA: LysM peptidoglycan-binding domain-containing M23 family metallopeptidase [Candidatus Polarisedimenticolia bacterium]|jgi:LysM repeat protein|nr:LysM peptidoglycan-binding domain-containing M23 family metallopeptidase [Candidatus Polarisedimenticolia bacterium]